jgi:threonine synthase
MAIKEVYDKYHYLPDPHGAVGFLALQQYLYQHPAEKGIFLETAHPVKFYDVVEPVINAMVPVPASIRAIMDNKKKAVKMSTAYNELKEYLLK